MANSIIYIATNIINGKSYIGQTSKGLEYRKRRHITDANYNANNMYFHKAIRKYGKDNFKWDILIEVPKTYLNKMEVFMIKHYNTFIGIGYNLNAGGGGVRGYKHSEESKRKMSISQKIAAKNRKKLPPVTDEHKDNSSRSHTSNEKYTFKHPIHGTEYLDRYEMCNKYNLRMASLWCVCVGKRKSLHKWIIINN